MLDLAGERGLFLGFAAAQFTSDSGLLANLLIQFATSDGQRGHFPLTLFEFRDQCLSLGILAGQGRPDDLDLLFDGDQFTLAGPDLVVLCTGRDRHQGQHGEGHADGVGPAACRTAGLGAQVGPRSEWTYASVVHGGDLTATRFQTVGNTDADLDTMTFRMNRSNGLSFYYERFILPAHKGQPFGSTIPT